MKIWELKAGDILTIRCKQGESMVDLKAHIADVRGEIVFLDLIRHEGKILDFSSPNIELIAIYEDGLDLPKAWTKCRIQRQTVAGKPYHVLVSGRSSVRVNRRRVSRVALGLPGSMYVAADDETMDITVVDLCANGIGIVCGKKIEQQGYKNLLIEFTDPGHDDDEIKVEAKIVWQKKREDGSFRCGCRLVQAEETLAYYIADKMREERDREGA